MQVHLAGMVSDKKSSCPFVSILVVTYNHEDYISQTLEGIFNQILPYSYNIIVADDCSRDNTLQVAESFKDKYPGRLTIVEQDQNIGFIQNYLSGLSKCNGKYLAFCEGDDFWIDERKLEKQINFLETHQKTGLVYTDFCNANANGEYEKTGHVEKNFKDRAEGNVLNKMIKGDNQVMTLTVCLRRSLLGADYVDFMSDKGFLTADFPTWLWCSFQADFHFIPEITAVYRRHDNQITNGLDPSFVWNFMRSHVYMRKKFLSLKKFKPQNWPVIETEINREILQHSLKLNFKREYGIASFRAISGNGIKYKPGDILFYLIIRYRFLNFSFQLGRKVKNRLKSMLSRVKIVV
jgi:glycosyltransferase involved in cell wall biosynthesis